MNVFFSVQTTFHLLPRQLCFDRNDYCPYLDGLGYAAPCVQQAEGQNKKFSRHFSNVGNLVDLASGNSSLELNELGGVSISLSLFLSLFLKTCFGTSPSHSLSQHAAGLDLKENYSSNSSEK